MTLLKNSSVVIGIVIIIFDSPKILTTRRLYGKLPLKGSGESVNGDGVKGVVEHSRLYCIYVCVGELVKLLGEMGVDILSAITASVVINVNATAVEQRVSSWLCKMEEYPHVCS